MRIERNKETKKDKKNDGRFFQVDQSIDNICPMDWKLISATVTIRVSRPIIMVMGKICSIIFTAVFPKASHGQVHKQVRP